MMYYTQLTMSQILHNMLNKKLSIIFTVTLVEMGPFFYMYMDRVSAIKIYYYIMCSCATFQLST